MSNKTYNVDVPGFGLRQLKVFFLKTYKEANRDLAGLNFLQQVRVGVTGSTTEELYNRLAPKLPAKFASVIQDKRPTYIISPPSTHSFEREYARDLASLLCCVDLSDGLRPEGKSPRATSGATAETLLQNWKIEGIPELEIPIQFLCG